MGFRAWVSLLLCHPSYKVSALALAGLVPLNTPAFHWSHGLSLVFPGLGVIFFGKLFGERSLLMMEVLWRLQGCRRGSRSTGIEIVLQDWGKVR